MLIVCINNLKKNKVFKRGFSNRDRRVVLKLNYKMGWLINVLAQARSIDMDLPINKTGTRLKRAKMLTTRLKEPTS